MEPESDGGRPINRYLITVDGMTVEASSSETSVTLREPDVALIEDTSYA